MSFNPEAADLRARRVLMDARASADAKALAEDVLALLALRKGAPGTRTPGPTLTNTPPVKRPAQPYAFTNLGADTWGVQVPTGLPASPGLAVVVIKKNGETSTVTLGQRVEATPFGERWTIDRTARSSNAPTGRGGGNGGRTGRVSQPPPSAPSIDDPDDDVRATSYDY